MFTVEPEELVSMCLADWRLVAQTIDNLPIYCTS